MSVTTAKTAQFGFGGEPVRCHACATQQRGVRKFVDGGGDDAGLLFRMTRTPDD